MFGVDGHPNNELVDIYLHNPSIEEKNRLYNEIDIWLAPTNLEGLHITPAEAMLTGATVVGTKAPMSGMQDYLIHNKTGLVSDDNQGSFIDSIRELIHRPDFRKKLGETSRQKILSLGSREENMEQLVKILETN
jgi:glycosyltransferase involved in cell wall biosynthesis